MGNTTIKFAPHNGKIEVCAIVGKARKNKRLAFFTHDNTYPILTDVEHWDGDENLFRTHITKKVPIPTAVDENSFLKGLRATLQAFAETRDFADPKDFFDSYKPSKEVQAGMTLLDFAIYYCNLERNNQVNPTKHESGNYRIYEKFVHKLQGKYHGETMLWAGEIQRFAKKPIADITDNDWKDWVKFLSSHLASRQFDFDGCAKAFRHVVYYYQRTMQGNHAFKFSKIDDNFKPKEKEKVECFTFTPSQIQTLVTLDPETLKSQIRQKRLLLDTAILLYCFQSRPIDVIGMRIEDLQILDDNCLWNYVPYKLRNRKKQYKRKVAMGNLPLVGLSIIKHYMGKRKSGYLLPYTKLTESMKYEQFKIAVNHISNTIGALLKHIAESHKWEIKDLCKVSLYTMRRTAITHLMNQGYTIDQVAQQAKTSREEIKEVYWEEQQATNSFVDMVREKQKTA